MLHSWPDVRLTAEHPAALLRGLIYLSVAKNKVVMPTDDTSPWGLRVPSPYPQAVPSDGCGCHWGGDTHSSSPDAFSQEQFTHHSAEIPDLVFALVPWEHWVVASSPHGTGKPSASQAFGWWRGLTPLQMGAMGMGVPRYNPDMPNANTQC